MALRATKLNEDAPQPRRVTASALSQWACGPRTMLEGAARSAPLFSDVCIAPSTVPPGLESPLGGESILPGAEFHVSPTFHALQRSGENRLSALLNCEGSDRD
jgi:hypothetical protein